MTYENVSIGPLLGVNQDDNPHALRRGELINATNAARFQTNIVGTRPGAVRPGATEDYENALTGTPPIQGAFEYRSNFDTGRRLVTLADLSGTVRLWYEDGSQVPAGGPPVIASDADNIVSIDIHENVMWGTGRDASDDIWTWDGNVANAPTVRALTNKADGVRLRPRHVKSWRGYVLMNGLSAASPTYSNNPAVTRFAEFGSDTTLDASWPDSNTIGFSATTVGSDSFGKNYATGFAEYTDNEGDFLLLLGVNGIAAAQLDIANDFRVTDHIANGCVSQRAYVDLGVDAGDGIYWSRHGIHSLRQSQQFGGSEGSFLSKKVKRMFETLNPDRVEFTCGAYDRKNGLAVFAISTGGSLAHDQLWALDVRDPRSLNADQALWYGPWFLKSASGTLLNVNHLQYARDEDNSWHLYAFTTEGDVLRFDENVFADLGSVGYEVIVQTKHDDIGVLGLEKRIGDALVHMGPGGSHAISMRTIFDYGARASSVIPLQQRNNDLSLVGTATVGLGIVGVGRTITDAKAYLSGKGRTISHEFRHSGADEPFFIGKLDVQVAGAGEDAGGASRGNN